MNNPEKLNKETMDLYKRENMNPFSGCLSGIVQIVILFAVFYLVKSPLTYMKKVDVGLIEQYTNEIKQESNNNAYPEISIIKEKGKIDEKVYINMDFLGIDLSSVPTQNLSDWRVYIIPGLYVITSFLSMRMTANMQNKKKKNEDVIDITEDKENKENSGEERNEMEDAMAQSNKMMSWMMPIMSVSISLVAPLGLALYWLISNISIILERLFLDKFLKEEEN